MKSVLLGTVFLYAFAGFTVAEETLIKGATVYTLSDTAYREDTDIRIRDGIILEVGNNLETGADAFIIDAGGKHVTPGLVSSASYLGLMEIGAVSDSVDVETEDEHYGASFDISPAINPASSAIPHNRLHGLTHAILTPGFGHDVFAGQGAVIRLDPGRDVLVERRVAVYARYDSGASDFAGGSRAVAYAKIRQALLDTGEFTRNRDAVRRGEWRDLSLPINDLAALEPVFSGDKPLVVISHRASDIHTLVGLKQEFDLDMIIAGASEAWMLADVLAENGIPVIIDPMANLPRNFDRLGARLDAAALLQSAGVKVIISDFTSLSHNPYLVRQSAGNAVAHGMDRIDAIRSITLVPAEVFGFADDYGSIEAGKVADLVIWDGDPLEIMTGVVAVLMRGKPVPLVSRSTRLRDRYRDLDSNTPFIFRK